MVYVVCIVNGALTRLTWQKAYELVWELHLAWILPINWYRYKLGRYRKSFFLHEQDIDLAELEFLFQLHRARCYPITERTIRSGDDGEMGISRGAFVARRTRGGKIYPAAHDPIEIVPTMDPSTRLPVNGYLFRRGIRWVVVLDTDPAAQAVDWTILTHRPGQDPGPIDPLLPNTRDAGPRLLMPPKGAE
jgi:hypothetical protein